MTKREFPPKMRSIRETDYQRMLTCCRCTEAATRNVTIGNMQQLGVDIATVIVISELRNWWFDYKKRTRTQ